MATIARPSLGSVLRYGRTAGSLHLVVTRRPLALSARSDKMTRSSRQEGPAREDSAVALAHGNAGIWTQETDESLAWLQECIDPRIRAFIARQFVPPLKVWEIDDVLQEGRLRLWQKRDEFDPARGTLDAWYWSICVRVAREWKRRPIRRRERIASRDEIGLFAQIVAPNPLANGRTPPSAPLSTELVAALYRAIAACPRASAKSSRPAWTHTGPLRRQCWPGSLESAAMRSGNVAAESANTSARP